MANLAEEVIEVLLQFHNAVLEGAPGTGKTYSIQAVEAAWESRSGRKLHKPADGVLAMTFHPNTTYESFIGGVQFDAVKNAFAPVEGFLIRAAKLAQDHPGEDVLILLDELNRANVPKVLGDALLCMEGSKRKRHNGTEWVGGLTVALPNGGGPFSLPDNLYILGTMNTTDRSIAPLDTALRRRFGFVRAEPLSTADVSAALDAVEADSSTKLHASIEALSSLNEILRSQLGPDAVLGHSYLFSMVGRKAAPISSPQAKLSEFLDRFPRRLRGFWLETNPGRNGAAANQFNIPDSSRGDKSLVDYFYPLETENGLQQTKDAARSDLFSMEFLGRVWEGNKLAWNSGGPNWKLEIRGKNGSDRLSTLTTPGILLGKYLVWVVDEDGLIHMTVLDRAQANLDALVIESEWTDSTRTASGRGFGLLKTAPSNRSERSDEKLVWRYAILPQLIDLSMQLGAGDVFDADSQPRNNTGASSERLGLFHQFLASLGLRLSLQGEGIGAALVVEDIPVVPIVSTTDVEDEVTASEDIPAVEDQSPDEQ